jgi:hypothetical protein
LYVIDELLVHARFTLLTFEYPEMVMPAGGSGGADVAEANVLVNPTFDVRTCTSVADPLFAIEAFVEAVLSRNAPFE